jgi:hypothetical protein
MSTIQPSADESEMKGCGEVRAARARVLLVGPWRERHPSRPRQHVRRPTDGLVPGARDIVLCDAGHFAALEAPDDVARILLDDAR